MLDSTKYARNCSLVLRSFEGIDEHRGVDLPKLPSVGSKGCFKVASYLIHLHETIPSKSAERPQGGETNFIDLDTDLDHLRNDG
jgi:hypothetical protein